MATSRKGWDALSTAYRGRLLKAGVSRKQYESGKSLQRARGHSKTPERPERAEQPQNISRYKEYREKRKRLIREVNAKKDELFAGRPKYNEKRSREASETGPGSGGKPPSIHSMQKFLSLEWEEFEADYADWWEDVDDWGFLMYH